MSVDVYTQKFEKLLIKCSINEPEEQIIMRYLGGLEPKYANVVELHQLTTFDEVCALVHKVEEERRRNPSKHEYPKPFQHEHLQSLPFEQTIIALIPFTPQRFQIP